MLFSISAAKVQKRLHPDGTQPQNNGTEPQKQQFCGQMLQITKYFVCVLGFVVRCLTEVRRRETMLIAEGTGKDLTAVET